MNSKKCLMQWHDYSDSVAIAVQTLKYHEELLDVTLACEGQTVRAHKLVLAASSQYFRKVLKDFPCEHPTIIIDGIGWKDLISILHFMYHGQVLVEEDAVCSLLIAATYLDVIGLNYVTRALLQNKCFDGKKEDTEGKIEPDEEEKASHLKLRHEVQKKKNIDEPCISNNLSMSNAQIENESTQSKKDILKDSLASDASNDVYSNPNYFVSKPNISSLVSKERISSPVLHEQEISKINGSNFLKDNFQPLHKKPRNNTEEDPSDIQRLNSNVDTEDEKLKSYYRDKNCNTDVKTPVKPENLENNSSYPDEEESRWRLPEKGDPIWRHRDTRNSSDRFFSDSNSQKRMFSDIEESSGKIHSYINSRFLYPDRNYFSKDYLDSHRSVYSDKEVKTNLHDKILYEKHMNDHEGLMRDCELPYVEKGSNNHVLNGDSRHLSTKAYSDLDAMDNELSQDGSSSDNIDSDMGPAPLPMNHPAVIASSKSAAAVSAAAAALAVAANGSINSGVNYTSIFGTNARNMMTSPGIGGASTSPSGVSLPVWMPPSSNASPSPSPPSQGGIPQSFIHPAGMSQQDLQATLEQYQRKLAFHEPRPCPTCRRMYRDAATLRTHIAIMHSEGKEPFGCTCGSLFKTKYDMYQHKKNGHR